MRFREMDRQGRLTIIFYLILFTAFPLYMHDKYFDIMNAKYLFYWVLGLTFILLSVIFIILDKRKPLPCMNSQTPVKKEKGKARLPFYAWMLLAFWGVSIISTVTSDFVYESFWGNEGRFTGLFLMTIYVFTTLIIARKGTVAKPLLDIFLLVSAVVCIIGITDFFRMDAFGWHIGGDIKKVDIFYSTIGNVNTYTSYLGLTLGVASGLYAAEEKPARCIFYCVVIILSFISLITGQSDNAYLSISTVLAFLPLYLMKTRRGLAKYVSVLASFALSAVFVVFVSREYEGICIKLKGMYTILEKMTFLPVLAAALVLLSVCLFLWAKKAGPDEPPFKNSVKIWQGILITGTVLLLAVLIDVNVLGHVKRYGPVSGYLHFNDSWGTNRGYGWRLGMDVYRELPLIHKLFGYGPDTYGIMVFGYRDESMAAYGYIFDAAHNEYLQYLTTIGPFGLISYVLMQIAAFREMILGVREKPWILAPLFATACYAAQSVVNISIPIATPVMWGLLAFGLAASRTAGAPTAGDAKGGESASAGV